MNALSLFSSPTSMTTIVRFFALLYMARVCEGEARQYGQSRNDLYSRPQVGSNQRFSGSKKLLTADESNAAVLKELGVDLTHQGMAILMLPILCFCIITVQRLLLSNYICNSDEF